MVYVPTQVGALRVALALCDSPARKVTLIEYASL
jgi:hypothetical protein